MTLTRNFNETLKTMIQGSQEFRGALLRQAVGAVIAGDLETGTSVLRKYVNGTVGFVKPGADPGRSPKVPMRMPGPTGNPQASNLFERVAHLKKLEGTALEVIDKAAA